MAATCFKAPARSVAVSTVCHPSPRRALCAATRARTRRVDLLRNQEPLTLDVKE